jgi:hypothetical protein
MNGRKSEASSLKKDIKNMKKGIVMGLLGLLFGLALFGFTNTASAAETQPDLMVLQQALDSLEVALNQLSLVLSNLENVELSAGATLPLSAMNATLGEISANLIDLGGTLARLDGSPVNLGAAMPGVELVADEVTGSGEKSLLASLNFMTIVIPSLIAVLGIVILTLLFFGRKGSEEKMATE